MDKMKWNNIKNALRAYSTYLAFCETDDEWNVIETIFDRMQAEQNKMAKESGITGNGVQTVSAAKLAEMDFNE